jgi:hypothetical protein
MKILTIKGCYPHRDVVCTLLTRLTISFAQNLTSLLCRKPRRCWKNWRSKNARLADREFKWPCGAPTPAACPLEHPRTSRKRPRLAHTFSRALSTARQPRPRAPAQGIERRGSGKAEGVSSWRTPSLYFGSGGFMPTLAKGQLRWSTYDERQDQRKTGRWCTCNVLRLGAFLLLGYTTFFRAFGRLGDWG